MECCCGHIVLILVEKFRRGKVACPPSIRTMLAGRVIFKGARALPSAPDARVPAATGTRGRGPGAGRAPLWAAEEGLNLLPGVIIYCGGARVSYPLKGDN